MWSVCLEVSSATCVQQRTGRHHACSLGYGHMQHSCPKKLVMWVTGRSVQMPDTGIHSRQYLEKNRRQMMPDDTSPDLPRGPPCGMAPDPSPALPLFSSLPVAYKCFSATGSRWTSAPILPSIKSTRHCWPWKLSKYLTPVVSQIHLLS